MRIRKLRQVMQEAGLDAMFITRPENQRYLSGFTGGEAALVITAQSKLLLTDFRYYEQVAEEAPDYALIKLEKSMPLALKQVFVEHGIKNVGFESTHLSYAQYRELKRPGTHWHALKDTVENIRMIKDAGELAAIKRAIAISDAACEHIRQILKPGITEKEVAWELESYMRSHGAEAMAFPIIAGSGPNGAKPHAVLQDRKLQAGEAIVMDFGARVDGYHSDVTRTLCIGKPSRELQNIYDIVLRAQLEAERSGRAGMQGREVDAIARKVISAAGHADHFGHGLGHGVGLAIHEGPGVGPRSTNKLEPGMVCTIEPGVYLPGVSGVRIEDMVLVEEEGFQVLTHARKEFQAR
jgi:Xaa-Pro aminopeptidase